MGASATTGGGPNPAGAGAGAGAGTAMGTGTGNYIGTSPDQQLPPPKQIRFVNNEGQPPRKRRRINAACRTCRKRKTRCDGRRPLCSTCLDNGHACTGYEEGNVRKDEKGSDPGRTKNDDDEEQEEEEDSQNLDRAAARMGAGHRHQRVPSSSSMESKQWGDLNQKPPEFQRRDTGTDGKKNSSKLIDHRVSPCLSDEESPAGMLSRITEDQAPTSGAERSSNIQLQNHRVPYFRYFGPTAIVPGFKQMVVSVREQRRCTGASSSFAMSPGSNDPGGAGSAFGGTSSRYRAETRSSVEMPTYDPTDPLPVNRLIIHIVETFFAHLGSNYPFLRHKSFIQRVEEKSVEPILVDAICALAARFSDHPLLVGHHDGSLPKSEYGNVFAQRAKAAVVDTFPCPTVAAVQACLLLAYEGFGANQDSALWMYLGCAIRMAVDLGLQKLDGVKHQGQKDPGYHRSNSDSAIPDVNPTITIQEMKEIEQERTDTIWAVFMLDRVISSGTGRPVTLKGEDFELSFPEITCHDGWPNPFPALIQIIHLYGRVTDLLNNIRNVKDVTPTMIESLQGMEKDLTQLYQRLDQRLTFNASNFQHYCKSGEGTNFILVHFWFHTLIMLVHQPTLIHSFEGQILSLLPHSRELSMSSAKTIADILAFAELIDPRSFIGNAFTSQPMYIAASAFLLETAAHNSQPASRNVSPPRIGAEPENKNEKSRTVATEQNQKQKHALLAAAANQNYQKCYKALQQLEKYWAGTRYLLVALDQKAKGIWDPETYTEQEYESTKVKPDFLPSWQRNLSTNPSTSGRLPNLRSPRLEHIPGSPAIDPSQAIGWSLTGTTNSPNSNLTFMYQHMNNAQALPPPPLTSGNMIYDPIRQSLPEASASSTPTSNYNPRYSSYVPSSRNHSQLMAPPSLKYPSVTADHASTSDAEMLLGLQNSPYSHSTPTSHHSYEHIPRGMRTLNDSRYEVSYNLSHSSSNAFTGSDFLGNVGDMMMESQEIDMSSMGGEIMPWLEYLPHDVFNFFDDSCSGAVISTGANTVDTMNMATGGNA